MFELSSEVYLLLMCPKSLGYESMKIMNYYDGAVRQSPN